MFTAFIATLPSTLEQGLIYAILALGIMLTYSILDFPDLTVDGSFPLGGAVTLTLLQAGHGPVTALLASLLAGALAGLCTGLIHVKLKVRALFSGIIMMTALYSVNLRITGGQALLTLPRTCHPFSQQPGRQRPAREPEPADHCGRPGAAAEAAAGRLPEDPRGLSFAGCGR